MNGLTLSLLATCTVAILFLTGPAAVQGETIQCYHCTNCPIPFDEEKGKKLSNCNYCRTTIMYDGEPRRVEKECVSTCAESDRRRDGRGMVVNCCNTPFCNPASTVFVSKRLIAWSAVLAFLLPSVWYKLA